MTTLSIERAVLLLLLHHEHQSSPMTARGIYIQDNWSDEQIHSQSTQTAITAGRSCCHQNTITVQKNGAHLLNFNSCLKS